MMAKSGTLSISYNDDKNVVVNCVQGMRMSNLSYNGFFGISARNTNKPDETLDMHLTKVTLINYDPTKYKTDDELLAPDELEKRNDAVISMREALGYSDEEFLKELNGEKTSVVFTDEVGMEAFDILGRMQGKLKELEKYMVENLGNIEVDDENNEVIYKMLEHARHINERLSTLNSEEELFAKSIRRYSE
jgi:hypothetical protein